MQVVPYSEEPFDCINMYPESSQIVPSGWLIW